MRGKGNLSGPFYSRSGITPACAGKRDGSADSVPKRKDHPRVCGEKTPCFSTWQTRLGSPPRVRGKVVFKVARVQSPGITPACAGKSCSGCCSCSCAGDHPRVCGEKSKEVAEYASKAGSPPRVRGKVEPFKGSMYQSRITPACAGKRVLSIDCRWGNRDHPRVCGEKRKSFSDSPGGLGSPPRVRGKV